MVTALRFSLKAEKCSLEAHADHPNTPSIAPFTQGRGHIKTQPGTSLPFKQDPQWIGAARKPRIFLQN
ncbi:UNVERIFIED_CONTAM: hypothetical protein FKN15_072894 [Acipenser sinensis]